MSLSFKVEKTWQLTDRGVLLVSGEVTGGSVSVGTRLREQPGTRTTPVLGVEFLSRDGFITVAVDPRVTWIAPGSVLVEPAKTMTATA